MPVWHCLNCGANTSTRKQNRPNCPNCRGEMRKGNLPIKAEEHQALLDRGCVFERRCQQDSHWRAGYYLDGVFLGTTPAFANEALGAVE